MVKRYKKIDKETWLSAPLLKTALDLSAAHFVEEGTAIAEILHEIGIDEEGLACAIIYPTLKAQEIHLDTLIDRFGEPSGKLLRDVLQMGALRKLQDKEHRKSHQLENLRKMLLAMVADVRAVLIVLAERLSLLRKTADKDFAQETLEIYAPLANRLGLGSVKWEMEDLCLRYLKPEIYKEIAKWLSSRREERERHIERIMAELKNILSKAGLKDFQVTGRVKHIYSIYKKRLRKGGDLNDIYDISAVRILVNNLEDCYAALGVVHDRWKQIRKEFDDYIAQPKPNGYRSIHTAVTDDESRVFEVQIRTVQMHEESELGVAAHWKYKEGRAKQSDYEAKIAWLRQVMEWQEEVASTKDLFSDRVYVFTPTGEIVDLPQGATPLDFAYHIHSEVGHRCKGAKVDGSIVPLTYQLQTGERVEILTAKQPNPSRDWMNPHSGYLITSRARAKVQHWFRAQELAEEEKIKEKHEKQKEKIKEAPLPELPILKKSTVSKKASQDIQILGVGHLLTQMAKCCKPIPGEPIIGYITQGKGVSIHRKNCQNILHVRESTKNKIIEVDWGEKISNVYPVEIKIEAYDRHGLIRDISAFFANEKINLLGIQSFTDKASNEAFLYTTLEISSQEQLQQILTKLMQIQNVIKVDRR